MFVTGGTIHLLLAAQVFSASVSGVVRDAISGDALAGVVVSLTDLDRATVTDGAGRYTFPGVPAGPQHLLVRRIGYRPHTLHALVPGRGTLELHIVLRAEPITLAAAAVQDGVPVGGVDDGDSTFHPDRSLSIAGVRHHPLLAEPDAFQALGGAEVVLRAEAPSGVHVRGGAADQVGFALDGIPVFSPFHAAGTFSAWNPDALSQLRLTTTSATFADVLSGVIAGTTRTPGGAVQTQGSLSTTQARVTIDGPLLPGTGVGFLVSTRSGFPGFPTPKRERSYLTGETGDWLAKIESPLFGGRIRVLSYGSEDEIGTSVAASEAPGDTARNAFGWRSRSAGGDWTRRLGAGELTVRVWQAESDAAARWGGDSVVERVDAHRQDQGLLLTADVPGARSRTVVGLRTEVSHTSYQVVTASGPFRVTEWRTRTPVSAAFLRHERSLGSGARLVAALTGARADGQAHLSPHLGVLWRATPTLTITGDYFRRHQFAQSLRNDESVVGMIFPAELFVGTGGSGVPVGRSDVGIVAAAYRPAAGIRLGAQAFARDFGGLVLVAPRSGGPFATDGFLVGEGTARGVGLEAAVSAARYGLTAAYGFQHVRLRYGDTAYHPGHGATHTLDAGAIVFPTATFSVRLGVSAVAGRRTTALVSPLEWESCNLLDRGCEFAGSPEHRTDALGRAALPAYVRIDLGVRKHWHVRIRGRAGTVALFGTVTNLFGRRNLLTVAPDPATGAPVGVEMRPRAPLVVGLDWRF